jgi:tRNA threonylcarbamoyladenosine biosynthesis protein TsaE
LKTPEDAAALGARLAAVLRPQDVVFLKGPLGVGKTTLARGLIRAWCGDPDIEAPSPTFTLVQPYDSPRGSLWHLDLFRLTSPEDVFELGLEEGFATALCLIEWPERLGSLVPADRLHVELELTETGRAARLRACGAMRARAGLLEAP